MPHLVTHYIDYKRNHAYNSYHSLFTVIWLLLNLSLSTAYDAIAVKGSYPTVLPQPGRQQAVGYDKSSNTILIFGGNNGKQGVTFNIGDETFDDLGTDYMPAGTSGNDYYTMIGTDLWTINGAGSGFLKINTATRNVNVPSTEIPTTISPHACLASHDHYLFVVGGWYDSHMQHIVQIYDITNDKWIMDAPLMQESRSVCGCIVNNNKLYVIAGLQSDTAEYIDVSGNLNNIASRQWQYVNGNLPMTLRALTAVNYGNKIIILGGRSDDSAPIYPVFIPVIDTSSNSFSIEGSLSYSVSLVGCIIVGNRVYMFGGEDRNGAAVDSYQYIDLPDIVESTSISGGSVFLIIFFVSIFIYCVGGYVFNGWKSKKWGDVKSNIPQLSFWQNVPIWTYTGCKVSYEVCRKRVNGDQEQLIETDDNNNL